MAASNRNYDYNPLNESAIDLNASATEKSKKNNVLSDA